YINGLLGVYELNQTELLRDVFVWAYERSCLLYSATCKTLVEPDPFRVRYRIFIATTIGEIVEKGMNKTQAVLTIKEKTKNEVPSEDQNRVIEIVESELLHLQEGNIARYRIPLAKYIAWKQIFG
ncbi:MAG: Fic family protein, partial [Chlamydiota bacterium]